MTELTCPKCGSGDSVHQTQFDHPDGERLIDVMRCLDCGAGVDEVLDARCKSLMAVLL